MMQPFNLEEFVAKYKNEKGFVNIVPLWPASKKPAVADYDFWFSNIYNGTYQNEQNIGVILGEIGGGIFGVDDDSFGNAPILDQFPNTFKTKSGEKGFHRFYRMAELPPYNGIKATKDGHVIEFFFRKRQFVLPPSIHPDTKKRYEIVDDQPVRTITKSEFEDMLRLLDADGWQLKRGDDEKSVIDRIQKGAKLGKGENRSADLLQFIDSVVLRLHKHNLPESFYQQIGLWYHREFTTEMYPQSKIEGIIRQAFEWANERPEKNVINDFDKLYNEGCGELDPIVAVTKLIGLYIKKDKIIEKQELQRLALLWANKFNLPLRPLEISACIKNIWKNKLILDEIKNLAYRHGQNHHGVILMEDQLIEAAYWLMGRYHIKRIELTGDLIFFNDKYYSRDTEEYIKREARKLLIDSTKNSLQEVIAMIEDIAPIIKSRDLDRYGHLKCLENGTYNIKTGEFTMDFDAEYIILNQIPHRYDETATYAEINKKVSEIIPDEKNRQSYYDFLSTCLHPHTGIDIMFIGIGVAGTGKSQIGEKFPPMIFGEDNVSFASIHSIAKDATVQNDIALKMLNIDAELSDDDINHINVIKRWVTQDKFSARSIYAHITTYKPTARLMCLANALFEIDSNEDAEAIYERTHIVRMDQKFRATEKEIKNVFEKVVEANPKELDGLITYLLKNATEIYGMQKIHNPMKPKQVMAIWNQFGNHIREFISKHVIHTKDASKPTKRESVWVAWQDYAMEKSIDEKTRNNFYEKFEQIIEIEPVKVKDEYGNTIVSFPGIRLKTDDELKVDELKASAEVMEQSLEKKDG